MDPYKWLPVSKPLWATTEGFMTSNSNIITAITAAASTNTPAKFSTGRSSTDVTAIESQLDALHSFYDLYTLSHASIFNIVKTTLDTLIAQYNAYSDLSYVGKPSTAVKTDLLDSTLADIVSTYNAYRATTLATNITNALIDENLPKKVYTDTYVQARKYIQDADISGVLTSVTKAAGYLVSPAYISLLTSYSTLPITGTGETAGTVRTSLLSALLTIVNTLVTKYNTENPATETTLPTGSSIADTIVKRDDILAKWNTLLTTRTSNVTTLVGDPASSSSTGTYQSARNSSDSDCTAPYSDTGVKDCWSDTAIVTRKGEVKSRILSRDTTGLVKYNDTPLSEYDIVNKVYKTFNVSRNNLLLAVNDLAFATITTFRNAYASLSIYLPNTYINQSDVANAVIDSAPPANSTDAKLSTDGQHIYKATTSSPSLTSLKTKYQNATRYVYNAVLISMDNAIANYNRLWNRYDSFRKDTQINLLYRNYTNETLTEVSLATNPAEYGLSPLSTTPTSAQLTNLQTLASTKLGTSTTSYNSILLSLITAIQGKLRIFFARADEIATATGYIYTSPSAELAVGQVPTDIRLIEIMDTFAGVEDAAVGAPTSTDIGIVSQGIATVSAAMQRFYKETYIPYVRYLTASAARSTTITTAVAKSLQYSFNDNGTMKTFADLSGDDTYTGLKTTIDAGMVAFVQALVNGYRDTRATWMNRGISTTAIAKEEAQVTVGNADSTRDILVGSTCWPQLLTDIKTFCTKRINAVATLESLYSTISNA